MDAQKRADMLNEAKKSVLRAANAAVDALHKQGKLSARERMKIMEETNDGFKISEKDLLLRGPGEFFGVRQHGLPELKIADLSEDMEVLKMAGMAAEEIIREDSGLLKAENQNLKERVLRRFEEVGGKGILN